MQKQIAIALLFGKAAAASGPASPAATGNPGYTNGSDYLAATVAGQIEAASSVDVNTGLYGCSRSGLLPVATQGLISAITNAAAQVQVTSQEAGVRSFYALDTASMGKLAVANVDDTATIAANQVDFNGVCAATAGAATEAGAAGDACWAAVASLVAATSVMECCVQSPATGPACVSAASMIIATAGGAEASAFGADAPLANRLTLWNDVANNIYDSGTNGALTGYTYDNDFLLSSMGQLSDNALPADNWCSQAFKTTIDSAASSYKAGEGFTSKTKCTWQVTAAATMAPQFTVASATTSNFVLQWVEWSNVASLASGMVLPAAAGVVADIATIANNFQIGQYTATEGVYFNPFLTGWAVDAAGDFAQPTPDAALGFYNYTPSGNLAGSIGTAFYAPNTAETTFNADAVTGADAGIFFSMYADVEPIYTAYTTAVTAYNSDADDYNTAVEAYNKALADGEKELPEVPERPCAPSAPAAWSGFTWNVENDFVPTNTIANDGLSHDGQGTVAYMATGTDVLEDAQRRGYVYSMIDASLPNVVFDVVADTAHVFGRLGQGALSQPGASAPWRWAEEAGSAQSQEMQVSVFPDGGVEFNGGSVSAGVATSVPFIATDMIDVTITEAALSRTFAAPAASGTATTLEDQDAAKALAMSAVAAVAAIASLY